MADNKYRTMAELELGLEHICQSPADEGVLTLIVRRPAEGQREVLAEGMLDLDNGLAGDGWRVRRLKRTAEADPAFRDNQVTLMNTRVIDLLAQSKVRWPLAGDQLYVDLDLSVANLPPGARLAIGAAVVEVSALPHTGCQQFKARFGLEALKFVNSEAAGRPLRLRGLNARVVQPGMVHAGDAVRKV